ncbi:hypothetical protein DYB28_000488 [Aphanomyces astaci]|uniref:Uncharacterized protein n=1 Tax=Aphanomyces astaci TaxID=112090 RepID=A0A397C4Y5_APHAT|nr:hypothetical protein DYB34_001985 [Aphanomyces astaci]RHY38446.1 hypothetical protein DYB25_014208 [Aphanomyces astaci]RLN99829.1 hypothetical protein DYB28_000488 [Aphanomyces astaci]
MKEVGVAYVGDSFFGSEGLHIILWRYEDGALYEVIRRESDKPRSLTCSGEEYLQSLHSTFHHACSTASPTTDLSVSVQEDVAKNEIVEDKALALRRRVEELEELVRSSDALVTKAIAAKNEVESTLIHKCVALLNEKKAKIKSLQSSSKAPSRRDHADSAPDDSDDDKHASTDEDDEAEVASQAYSHLPVSQTHVTAKQVLDGADDDFLDML